MNDTPHAHIQKHVKTYIWVFLALAIGTVLTVLAAKVHMGILLGIIVALIIATVKGSLVAAFFMHLNAERKPIYWILAMTGLFVLVMVGLIMFTHHDQQGRPHGIFVVPQGHVPAEHAPGGSETHKE